MKLSSKTRYGIRSLLDLANFHTQVPVPIKHIARRQAISERYLENIFLELKKFGLLNSVKGKNGGFYLAKPLTDISVLDVMNALEGGFLVSHCVENDACKKPEDCQAQELWKNLDKTMKSTLSNIRLMGKYPKGAKNEYN